MPFVVCTNSPVFGVWTLDVLTFFQMSLEVHGEQRGAGRVVGAAYWPVVTTGFVFSADEDQRKGNNESGADEQQHSSLRGSYLRVDNLMVKGQPRGSTSYAPGFPATVEVGAEADAPPAAPAVAVQPYLQWINNSPICSATAMLFTTTVSLAASTGHLSEKYWKRHSLSRLILIRILSVWQRKSDTETHLNPHLKSRHTVCRKCAEKGENRHDHILDFMFLKSRKYQWTD